MLYTLLEYLKNGKLTASEGLSEKNLQKATAARDMINARSNTRKTMCIIVYELSKIQFSTKEELL